jgi:ribulose-phosphate 3-epimerase
MSEIIPAILAHDEDSFREKILAVKGLAPLIQIDVMDGFFTANGSWYRAGALLEFPEQNFELHLMVEDPGKFVKEGVNISNVTRLVWHVEAEADQLELVSLCQAAGKEAGLAVSPATPLEALEAYAPEVDEILVLGVEPGASGQSLKPSTVEKARAIHQRWPNLVLAFDGGVDKASIPKLKAAGVTRFCVASAIFEAKDPGKALKGLAEK